MGFGQASLAQADGSAPILLAAGSAPGESGVSVHKWRFRNGAHFRSTADQHHIWFASPARFHCRIDGRALSHDMPAGSLAIGPHGIDCHADAEGSFDSVLITIDPARLSLAAAEDTGYDARLLVRLLDHDPGLAALGGQMAEESARGYPNGPLFWNEIADRFIAGLLLRHTAERPAPARGGLSKAVMRELRDYVTDHLDEPITVAALATLAGRSPFHFTRIFIRSVGISPHRYIVHRRLQHAMELLRGGQLSLAEIAVRTGFADQSHLSRWMRRAYGATLTQVAKHNGARLDAAEKRGVSSGGRG